ncbi:hypothetical protein GCM10025868_06250 [Angustibacter aerolatus]|uniref:Uncharacterized protein n=1 Tax=Angustibacter aerolatus TaxID=1162965 RepID=A0ABQ6JEX8_9ACTN|nr:hypothetical protein GCM10025868_06250 [Angustibacter aerolatus]
MPAGTWSPRYSSKSLHPLDQRSAALAQGPLDVRRRHGHVDDERDVAQRHGVRGHRLRLADVGHRGEQHVEVDLGGAGALGQVEGGEHRGRELAGVADQRAVRQRHPGAATGVPRGVPVGRDLQPDAERLGQPAHRGDGVGPVGGPARPPPAGRLALADEEHGRVQRLRRHGGLQLREHGGVRPGGGLGARRLRAVGGAGTEHPAHLEQREVAGAAGEVAPGRVAQRLQQGGAQQRRLLAERVREPQRPPAVVVVRQAQRVEPARRDERVGLHLDVPVLGERRRRQPPQPLRTGQATTGGGRRQHADDLVVPRDAGDLLDEVGALDEVGSPRRGRDQQVVLRALHLAAHGPQRAVDRLGVELAPHQARGQVGRHADRRHRRPLVDVGDAVGGAAGVLDEQPDGEPRPRGARGRGRRRARSGGWPRCSPCAGASLRATVTGSNSADSTSRSRVVSVTSPSAPPMTPAIASTRLPAGSSTVTSRSSACRARSTPSSVVSRSPGAARRTTTGPPRVARSKACSGWPVTSIT